MSGNVEIDRNSIVIMGDPNEVFTLNFLALRSNLRFYASEVSKFMIMPV
ncbi:hypothetical protein SLEP1_g24837 [Rubroshorea leprosula]|uniref:Uncharacterized protein n=1 Tax=Rubroshorea leprosula TaxID=152421 RepID=A0AAV5JT20_9ROSI|nr:hypothetical protein SLEP1_g24837 [Rubroshorea leprosula]